MANERARLLRRNMTDAERRLWRELRAFKDRGHHFRRQVPIGPYIADFCCHGAKLVIEVDGGQHNETEARRSDEARTARLQSVGYRVLRVWNTDVLTNTEGVVELISASLYPHPHPSPQGGGAFSGDHQRSDV